MINLKETKQGNYAIIVGKEHREMAMRILVQVGTEMLSAGKTEIAQEVTRTLADVRDAVGGAGQGMKLTLNQTKLLPPSVKSVSRLSAEKQANELIAIVASRIPNYHHSKLRTFYTEIEQATGAKLHAAGKRVNARIRSSEIGKYPYRKMDLAIQLIGAERVLEYARRYEV